MPFLAAAWSCEGTTLVGTGGSYPAAVSSRLIAVIIPNALSSDRYDVWNVLMSTRGCPVFITQRTWAIAVTG